MQGQAAQAAALQAATEDILVSGGRHALQLLEGMSLPDLDWHDKSMAA